jgi:hypothetical protein
MALLSGGCAVSGVGRDEQLLFEPDPPQAGASASTLSQPHAGLPLSVEMRCPGKVDAVSVSPLLPLPPVLPVGLLANQSQTYVHLTLPATQTRAWLGALHLSLADGSRLEFAQARQRAQWPAGAGMVKLELVFDRNCRDLHRAALLLDAIEHEHQQFAPLQVLLRFETQRQADWGYISR